MGVVCSCSAPGPGMIKAILPPGIHGPDRGCVAPDWFCLHQGCAPESLPYLRIG